MRKKVANITLFGTLLVAALALLDLIFFTDKTTGFVTVGGIFLRYAVVFVCFLICVFPLLYKKGSVKAPGFMNSVTFSLILVGIMCDVYGFFSMLAFFTGKGSVFGLIEGLLIAVLGISVMNATLCQKSDMKQTARKYMVFAIAGSAGLYLMTIERFITRTSSIYRFAPTIGVLSALAAVVFSTSLIKALCLNADEQAFEMLMAKGQVAFLLCTCIEMPHTLYLCITGYAPLTDALSAVLLGSIGLAGILLSRACVRGKSTSNK